MLAHVACATRTSKVSSAACMLYNHSDAHVPGPDKGQHAFSILTSEIFPTPISCNRLPLSAFPLPFQDTLHLLLHLVYAPTSARLIVYQKLLWHSNFCVANWAGLVVALAWLPTRHLRAEAANLPLDACTCMEHRCNWQDLQVRCHRPGRRL
jgi:hypothetical protein